MKPITATTQPPYPLEPVFASVRDLADHDGDLEVVAVDERAWRLTGRSRGPAGEPMTVEYALFPSEPSSTELRVTRTAAHVTPLARRRLRRESQRALDDLVAAAGTRWRRAA